MIFTPNIGVPFYDPLNPGRIWSLIWNGTVYSELQYSYDYGVNWTYWGPTPQNANYSALSIDSKGNFYYARSSGITKLDRNTGIGEEVVTFEVAFDPHNWFTWHFAEDNQGNIFTTGYSQVGPGGQYVYHFDGVSWNRLDILVNAFPTLKHIHSIHVNPYNNKLYICVGDELGARNIIVSDDRLVTYSIIGEPDKPGPTGLTFTSEATYITTDVVGSQNYLKSTSDDLNFVNRWSVPSPYNISPTYFVRALNDNEMWVLAYNETGNINTRTALFKLTKDSGELSPWNHEKIIVGDDLARNGYSLFQIAGGLNGVIPNTSPYIFAERIGRKGVYRFARG